MFNSKQVYLACILAINSGRNIGNGFGNACDNGRGHYLSDYYQNITKEFYREDITLKEALEKYHAVCS